MDSDGFQDLETAERAHEDAGAQGETRLNGAQNNYWSTPSSQNFVRMMFMCFLRMDLLENEKQPAINTVGIHLIHGTQMTLVS